MRWRLSLWRGNDVVMEMVGDDSRAMEAAREAFTRICNQPADSLLIHWFEWVREEESYAHWKRRTPEEVLNE